MPKKAIWAWLCALLIVWAVTACAFAGSDTVPASVSGVNYTDEDIHYALFDPNDSKQKVVASEDLGPFAAGGVMCCYDVPKTWKPGTKVGVFVRAFDNKAMQYRDRQTFIVELPPYDKSGKAGDVWFINYPDGTVGVVSTAFRPDGEEWPGKIKGWPKPSLAFQRELWERDMKLAQESLTTSKEFKEALDRDPKQYLQNLWLRHLKYVEDKVGLANTYKRFSGPDDPTLLEFERARREEALRYDQDEVDRLLKIKP